MCHVIDLFEEIEVFNNSEHSEIDEERLLTVAKDVQFDRKVVKGAIIENLKEGLTISNLSEKLGIEVHCNSSK